METELELNTLNKSIKLIIASINRLSRQVKLSEARYPYFPLTFSLWRQNKYCELLEQNNICNK
jgi:hypothetical protein